MSKGIDSPTVETLNRWFEACLYFEEQVEKLDLEQLDYLERYLLQVNRKERERLIESLELKDLENLKIIKDEIFKENIEDYEFQIIDALEVSAEAVNELNTQLIELKKYDSLSISDWLDEYNFNLDILLVDEIIGDEKFREICDLFNIDEDVITVLESVNMMIEELTPKEDCSSVFRNKLPLYLYGVMRYLCKELGFNYGTYNSSIQAGDVIGKIIYDRFPYVTKWELETVVRNSKLIYSTIIMNKKLYDWNNIRGTTEFNRRFKSVIQLSESTKLEIEKCINTYK